MNARSLKHRGIDQNSSNVPSDTDVSNGVVDQKYSKEIFRPNDSGTSLLKRRAVGQERDNVFLDFTKPRTTVAPGDSVAIRCVTPWLGMVNAWKKDDVVLSSGQPGVLMTSVRLRHEKVKEFIEAMAELEQREKLNREEKQAKLNRVRLSAGKGVMEKGDGTEVKTADEELDKSTASTEDQDQESNDVEEEVVVEPVRPQRSLESAEDQRRRNHQQMEHHKRAQRATNIHGRARGPHERDGPAARLETVYRKSQKLELWTLSIENVSFADAGNYTCGGEAITYFRLRVEERGEEQDDEHVGPPGKVA